MYRVVLFFLFLLPLQIGFSLAISPETAEKIGERIWKNECAGSVEGLAHWNKGENFASLGIGHFIWYHEGGEEKFQETFPSLLVFLEKRGEKIPEWLQKEKKCPWTSREEFYAKSESLKMKSLRQFLFDTRGAQAVFMAERLEKSFFAILEETPSHEKNKIEKLFHLLTKDAKGLYALIDYLNFKGDGISPLERYQGQGWGLSQVLQRVPEASKAPLYDFVQSAKEVLSQRVKNAPPERNEGRWLKGWHNRIETYCN